MHHPQAAVTLPAPTTWRLFKTLAVLWAALWHTARRCPADSRADRYRAGSRAGRCRASARAGRAVPVPPYSARVLDTTSTLNTQQIASLNEQILAIEADTRAAVVVFMLPTTGEDSIEEYATRVFEKWKLGDTQRDDGILILVALEDRRMRIEVGQGLEGTVPDVLAGRIIDQDMKPRFRRNDYAADWKRPSATSGRCCEATLSPQTQAPVASRPLAGLFLRHCCGVSPRGWLARSTAGSGS